MHRNRLLMFLATLASFLVLRTAFAEDYHQLRRTEKTVEYSEHKDNATLNEERAEDADQFSNNEKAIQSPEYKGNTTVHKQPHEVIVTDAPKSEVQLSGKSAVGQRSSAEYPVWDVQDHHNHIETEVIRDDHHHSDHHNAAVPAKFMPTIPPPKDHHHDEHDTVSPLFKDHHHRDDHTTRSGRQFHDQPYHPMLDHAMLDHPMFQKPSGFSLEAIRRQFGGGFGSNLLMVGLTSLPIIGLLSRVSSSSGNLFGVTSRSKKSSSKRNRRSLKDKAVYSVAYAKKLWNIMQELDKSFENHDLHQVECRLRVVCEAHHKGMRLGTWGQSIVDLMSQQKKLGSGELLLLSRLLFSDYAEAAQAGGRNEDCSMLYNGCPKYLSYYLRAKEGQMENEVNTGM